MFAKRAVCSRRASRRASQAEASAGASGPSSSSQTRSRRCWQHALERGGRYYPPRSRQRSCGTSGKPPPHSWAGRTRRSWPAVARWSDQRQSGGMRHRRTSSPWNTLSRRRGQRVTRVSLRWRVTRVSLRWRDMHAIVASFPPFHCLVRARNACPSLRTNLGYQVVAKCLQKGQYVHEGRHS